MFMKEELFGDVHNFGSQKKFSKLRKSKARLLKRETGLNLSELGRPKDPRPFESMMFRTCFPLIRFLEGKGS